MKSLIRETLIDLIAGFIHATDNNEIINFIFEHFCFDEEVTDLLFYDYLDFPDHYETYYSRLVRKISNVFFQFQYL